MVLPTTEIIEPFKWTAAIGSVAQYALFKSAGAAVKSIRKSSISSADDVSLKTNLDNDVVDLSSSKSNNLTLKTGSDLSIPKTQNHVDVPSSAKSHVDVPTSGVADAELTKVKQTADLNLSTKSSVNVPTSKTADIDLPTVKSYTDMNLSSETVSNAVTAAAVSGVKPTDLDVPRVKDIATPSRSGDAGVPKMDSQSSAKMSEPSRLEYLRNKYGRISTEELNQRINLRGETMKQYNEMKEVVKSKRQLGPAFATVYDKTTGKYYSAINNFDGKKPGDLHPLLQERFNNASQDLIDSYVKKQKALPPMQKYMQ